MFIKIKVMERVQLDIKEKIIAQVMMQLILVILDIINLCLVLALMIQIGIPALPGVLVIRGILVQQIGVVTGKFEKKLKTIDKEYLVTYINMRKYPVVLFAMAKIMEMNKEEQNQVAIYLVNNV